MRTKAILLTLILFSQLVYAQSERKKKSNYSKFFSREYYVLKEDKSVKDGPYELSIQGTLVIQGQYKEDQKDGLWTYYNSKGKILFRYDYTNKTVTEWSHEKMDVVQWQNGNMKRAPLHYQIGRAVPYTDHQDKLFTMIKGTNTVFTQLDRPPLLLGSNLVFQFELFQMLLHELHAFHGPFFSLISFIVDTDGNAKNFKVEMASGLGFEEKFMQKLIEKNYSWVPAELGGEQVAVEVLVPVIVQVTQDLDHVITNIVFSDTEFLNQYARITRGKGYKILESWDYKLYD